MKIFITLGLLVLSLQASASKEQLGCEGSPEFMSIAKNNDGSVNYMSEPDAYSYCSARGGHLPTAQELVQLSTCFGAKGIVLECERSDFKCSALTVSHDYGSVFLGNFGFRYSSAGYQQPAGDIGRNFFWTSSLKNWPAPGGFLLFDGYLGRLEINEKKTDRFAVLCVSDK